MNAILISEVLALHNSHSTECMHSDILGDAFLIKENRVYRNIKTKALQIGCRYSEAWPQYLSLPFHELNKIIAEKNIPYVPSARMLQEIENKRAHTFTTDQLQAPESYHLHEAAHVIADSLFRNINLKTREEKILKAILCESFANTVDALACVYATTEIHQYFLVHNCYMNPDKEDLDAMLNLIERHGFKHTFMLVLIGYLHSNFMRQEFSQDLIQEIIGENSADTDAIVQMCEKLDPLFRVQTTEMYLQLEGYDGEVFEILDFPFMQILKQNADFRLVTESMAQILEA